MIRDVCVLNTSLFKSCPDFILSCLPLLLITSCLLNVIQHLSHTTTSSIKLWSLTSQHCLYTFTHHSGSVWALHSTHPSLEIFYSGHKSGPAARVDVEGSAHMFEAECALICQGVAPPAEGVTKLVALDDSLVWTASGNSGLRRWRASSRRAVRVAALVESPTSATSRTTSPRRFSVAPTGDHDPSSLTCPRLRPYTDIPAMQAR